MSRLPVRPTTRNHSLDIVRVVAILMVVMIHCSASFVDNYNGGDLRFFIANLFDSVARPGVPLFLMVSGALMLDETRQKSTADVFRTAKKVFILLVLWSILYVVVCDLLLPPLFGKRIPLYVIIEDIFFGFYHLWYLYMLLGLYIATPFLRCFVKRENSRLVLLYIGISLVTAFVEPALTILSNRYTNMAYLQSYINQLHLDFFGGFTAYFLAGWYIVHVGIPTKWLRRLIYLVSGLSLAVIIAVTQRTGDSENMYSNQNIFIFLYSLGIFLFITNRQPVTQPSRVIGLLSKLSFGIYVIHEIFNILARRFLSDIQNPLVHIPLRYVIVFGVSFCLCWILSKIPVVKKLIRC